MYIAANSMTRMSFSNHPWGERGDKHLQAASSAGAPVGIERRQHVTHARREVDGAHDVALEVGKLAGLGVWRPVADDARAPSMIGRGDTVNAGKECRG